MNNIQSFCGLDSNCTFNVWNAELEKFSNCFLWTVASNVTHGFFLVICAYLLGLSKKIHITFKKYHRNSKFLCCLLVVNCLVEVILSYALHQRPSPAYVLSKVIALTCWVMCFALQYRSYPSVYIQKKRNWCLFTISLFVILSASLQVHADIKDILTTKNMSISTWPVRYFGSFLYTIFCIYFCIICIFTIRHQNVMFVNSRNKDLQVFGSDVFTSSNNGDIYSKYSQSYAELNDEEETNAKAETYKAETGNFLSRLTLWWVNKVVVKGHRKQLKNAEDLFILPDKLKTNVIRERFSDILKNERQRLRDRQIAGKPKKLSLLKILSKTYGRLYYGIAITKLLMILLEFSGPIFLNYLVSYMENKKEPMSHGYYYAGALFLCSLVETLITGHYFYYLEVVRVYLRASLITAIYEKTMMANTATLTSRFTTGQVVNYMSTDVDRILEACYDFHELWGVPIQMGLCLYLLYGQLGISFLASVGVLLIFSPTTWYVTMKIKALMEKMMGQKDDRVKIVTEILHGIRIIKFYAWEKHFEEEVNKARVAEMKTMRVFKYLQAFCVFFWTSTPFWMCIATFTTFALLGNTLTAANVFTSMALFSILNQPLNDLPWCISGLTNCWVSLKRLDLYLSMPQVDLEEYYLDKSKEQQVDKILEVVNATFTWKDESAKADKEIIEKLKGEDDKKKLSKNDKEGGKNSTEENVVTPFNLKNINLSLYKGLLVGITGKVGSGKSSLFGAIISEMQKICGELYLQDDIKGFAYVAQESWIQNMTVKDNILFGKPFNEERYDAVLSACALKEDLKTLQAGDQTEIGENGINLSGGQKARVAFARAVYQDKEVYFLDDPLAAVDSHVAAHLFKHCIMGLLKHKTRILSTHHIKYLWQADRVILMKDGYIVANGHPDDVLINEEVQQVELKDTISIEENIEKETEKTEQDKEKGKLVEDEEKEEGTVSIDVYKYYFKSNGVCVVVFMCVFICLLRASEYTGDWWLAYWTSNVKKAHKQPTTKNITSSSIVSYNSWRSLSYDTVMMTKHEPAFHSSYYYSLKASVANSNMSSYDLNYYLGIYCGVVASGCVFTLIRALLSAYGCIRASILIHKKLLATILRAPVAFFDVTPIGRIINRLSSDIYSVDADVAIYFQATLSMCGSVIGAFIMACYSIPWFTAVLLPLMIMYYYTQSYYRQCSRELKRISSVTRSPIYQHFTESLNGLMTIRSFREVPRFIEQNEKILDENQRAYFSTQVIEAWLWLRLGSLGVLMISGVAVLAVIEHHYQSINPGLVGLAITVALSVQGHIHSLLMVFTRLEKGMVGTERIVHYIKETTQEAIGSNQIGRDWPNQGVISFQNVALRYREELPLVVNDVSFNILSGEKVGVCGRTGSGKSSLFRLLFKIVDITSGEIIIDDISLQNACTEQIRTQMSIIPQEPFLFDATVSLNLDPTNEYSDEEKLDVLEKCHLTKAVQDLGGLSGNVGERGSNLSSGQKQLICLGRALLKKSKIICIDEATASVDLGTDNLIQQTIRTEFSKSTVLTIAHRLETIMDSDRVLVMNYGRVAEFASPHDLMSDSKSLFSMLVREDNRNHKNN